MKDHVKIVAISMYTNDIAALKDKVSALKARGLHRANQSRLIRIALDRLDISTITYKDMKR